jgi:ComF family protein
MPLLERLLSLIAPHECINCGTEGSLLCAWCVPDACADLPDTCYRCHKLSAESKVCGSCRKSSSLSHVWVRTEYDGISKELLRRYKFDRAQGAAPLIAQLISEKLPYLPSDTLVTYVPTVTSHIRQRGYDHALGLARELANDHQLRLITILRRHGQARQVGSRRQQRQEQLKDAFSVKSEYLVKGKTILLVDDIVTTGATLEAAAKCLKQAGAKRIYATTLAQKH